MKTLLPTALLCCLASCATYPQDAPAPEPQYRETEYTAAPDVALLTQTTTTTPAPEPKRKTDYRIAYIVTTVTDDFGVAESVGVDKPSGVAFQFARPIKGYDVVYGYGEANVTFDRGSEQGVDIDVTRYSVHGGIEGRMNFDSMPGSYLFAQLGVGFSGLDISAAGSTLTDTPFGVFGAIGGTLKPSEGSPSFFIMLRPLEPDGELGFLEVSFESLLFGVSWAR